MYLKNPVSKNKLKEIVKLHTKKYRDKSDLFIAEGFKPLEEIIANNVEIIDIFALKGADISGIKIPVTIIDETVMEKISTTNSVCEILTVAKKRKYAPDILCNLNRIILIDSISDPGNLGTIIRSASAFNIDGIILYNNCVDLYSTKVIRSAAGNLFKTPIFYIKNIQELQRYTQNHKIIAASLKEENNISFEKCANLDKYIIMFGSEAKGLSSELTNLAEKNIKIEMKKNVESLNLSVSVSIILYELCQKCID